jgi:hypothetical protein
MVKRISDLTLEPWLKEFDSLLVMLAKHQRGQTMKANSQLRRRQNRSSPRLRASFRLVHAHEGRRRPFCG